MSERRTSYNTIKDRAIGEIIEKKSRFIANVIHIESEEEAISHIEKIKKENWDARHNCYAYILGKDGETVRFSDDGEPSGTAGKPMLEVLQKRELTEVLVVVTRYFGGVLLGTGGLARAYTDATIEGLENGKLQTLRLYQTVSLTLDYGMVGAVKNILSKEDIITISENYMENVVMEIGLLIEDKDIILSKITNATNGKAKIEPGDEIFI